MAKTKSEANVEIDVLVKKAHAAIEQAMKLADKFGCDFAFSVAYGMGGHYTGRQTTMSRKEAIAKIASSNYLDEAELELIRDTIRCTTNDEDIHKWHSSTDGWCSSSMNC